MSGCLRRWVGASPPPYRVTRPLRLLPTPAPPPVTVPVWTSGGRPPIPADSPALRSIRPGAFRAKRWRKQGALWGPVASPAGNLSAEHLTLRCSPPLLECHWLPPACHYYQAEKSAPRSSCAACQLAQAGAGIAWV